jgi:hypothetical protein
VVPRPGLEWSEASDSCNRPVIVTMPLVRVMQVAFHEIVGMATVRNRFMSAAAAMSVFRVVRSAGVVRRAGGRIRTTLGQGMFIHVLHVDVVKVSIVQIIDVTFMLDRGVSASWTMRMRVLLVCFVIVHFPMLSLGSKASYFKPA